MSAVGQKSRLRRLAVRAADTHVGHAIISHVAAARPELLTGALGYFSSRDARLEARTEWPAALAGFEDVAPVVLSSSAANRGVASMWLNEAAHLWRLAAQAGPATLIEIGRERGGSTLIIAAAMHPNAKLYSYDPQTKHTALGREFDAEISAVLARYDLGGRVELIQEDSHVSPVPEGEFALVLVDGDPSLAGTRLDFERFCIRTKPGGHVLFHDAAPGGPRSATLAPLIAEIEKDPRFSRQQDVGTFVDFLRSTT